MAVRVRQAAVLLAVAVPAWAGVVLVAHNRAGVLGAAVRAAAPAAAEPRGVQATPVRVPSKHRSP